MTIFPVLLLGALGVGLRFGADLLIRVTEFPLATIVVNLIGCFIAGYLFTSSHPLRIPLMVGLCGGLTTFSALIIQCLQMLREGMVLKAGIYLLGSVVLGLLAAWTGMKISGS